MNRIRRLGLFIILAAFFQSCVYEQITPEIVDVPEDVSWSIDVLPILVNNCNVTGCHVSGSIPPDLSSANAYINLTFFGYVDTNEPESSELYKKINGGSMKDFVSEQEKAIILRWIEDGALEN